MKKKIVSVITIIALVLLSVPIVLVGCGTREQELEIRVGHRHRADVIMVTGGRPDSNGVLIIPAYINGLPVVAIGARAFSGNTSLRRVVIPYTVEVIEGMAFYNCNRLEDVTFEERSRLRTIEVTGFGGTFEGTPRLRSIVLPEGLEYIGASAFFRSGLENANIPSTVTQIGTGAFSNGVLPMGGSTHAGGTIRIKSITIPYSVIIMGGGVFAFWTANQTIYIEGRYFAPDTWAEGWSNGIFESEAQVIFLG